MVILRLRRCYNQRRGKGVLYRIYYETHFIGYFRSSNNEYARTNIFYEYIENNALHGRRVNFETKKENSVKYILPKNNFIPIEKDEVKLIYR